MESHCGNKMEHKRASNADCEHRFTEIETLLSNHIPHVNAELSSLKKMLWWIFSTLMGGLVVLIVNILLKTVSLGPAQKALQHLVEKF